MQCIIQLLCAETHFPQFLCFIRFLRQDHQDQERQYRQLVFPEQL